MDQQSNPTIHVRDDGFHFGDLRATSQYDHPQRRHSGHPMLLSTHEDTSTITASYVSPEDQNRDAGEYHSNMNVPPPSLNAQPQRYDLLDFPNRSMPLPAVSKPTQVEDLTRSAVAMSPHIQQSEQADLTGCSTAIHIQDENLCSVILKLSQFLSATNLDVASITSMLLLLVNLMDFEVLLVADDMNSLHENSEHVHASSSAVSSETNNDAESQSMPSDASITNVSSERDPSPKAESGSVWTGIKIFAQDSKPPKENHLRVGIHGGKPSSSTIVFVQRKVKFKDAWTRSFILKAAPMVDHPPDFELPRGSGLLCPNDLFVCVDLSSWHQGEDALSANSISSTTISSSTLSSNSSTASSRNNPLHWSDPSMSQYLRIWCWDNNLKKFISSNSLALLFRSPVLRRLVIKNFIKFGFEDNTEERFLVRPRPGSKTGPRERTPPIPNEDLFKLELRTRE
ncbi:hypothetical protein C8J55DRAFT_487583 [Lentinula edodes]|uniref:Uncharacterized protein n=1 Tax=Lentinula lateritia TaxID=40482 RepID=A0A9W9AN00_9AGAR|nr:hypothetical protein C8J55DRAFT_487583 [Lentinula edodes]